MTISRGLAGLKLAGEGWRRSHTKFLNWVYIRSIKIARCFTAAICISRLHA